MGLAYSSEYQSLKRNSAAICRLVLDRKDVQWLAQQLCSLQVISNDEKESSLEPREKARYLVQRVEKTVRLNPSKYHLLVRVLKEKESDYRPVLDALSRSYAATWMRHLLLYLGVLTLLIAAKGASALSRNFTSSQRADMCYYPPLPIQTITLPDLPTPLYGRSLDVHDLTNRLRSNTSFVSLYGPPGVGKSTLALSLAHAFQDGGITVYRADMRLSCDVEEVAREVLRAAGWHGAARAQDLVGEVVEWARDLDDTTLLVLDNCDDFLTGSKSVFDAAFERVAEIAVCFVSPNTCADIMRHLQRKGKFGSLLSGLLRSPGHLKVVVTSTAGEHVVPTLMTGVGAAHTLLTGVDAAVHQFLVRPLDSGDSVSLLQHYVPELNASAAGRLAGYVGNVPQALAAIATSLRSGVARGQSMDVIVGPMAAKLEEGDTFGFLVTTGLDDGLGPSTMAYRDAYYHLTDDVKKCGRVLAQSTPRVFTQRIAERWLQSWATPDQVAHCLGVLEERGVVDRQVVATSGCVLVLYQFRSLYKECFTFEQKKIWFPAVKELRDFKEQETRLLEEYVGADAADEWVQTYYCTPVKDS